MTRTRTPTPVHPQRAPESAATVPPDASGAQSALPAPSTAADTSTHLSVRTTVVQQAPDHRDAPAAPNLPWWRYAFPTAVDAIVAGGIIHLLSAGKLRADWLQALALVGLLLIAGVRAADLSSMMRGGQGIPPGAGPAAIVGAGITAAAHVLVRASSSGRASAPVLLACLIALACALLCVPSLLHMAGGFR